MSAEGKAIAWPESFLGDLVPRARIIAFDYDVELGDFWATEEEGRMDDISSDLSYEVRSIRTKPKTVSSIQPTRPLSLGSVRNGDY